MTDAPAAPPARSTGARHLAGLDGLRAVAVLLVIVYHAFPAALPGGWLGVDVFFVISGFLITGLLIRERMLTGGIRLRGFWVRRARRLLPALVLLLLVCSFAASIIRGDVLAGIPAQLLGAATFSSNWVAIATGADYIGQTAPELYRNLWSLAVEEQFYVLWPLAVLLIALLPARWARVLLVSVLALASALAMALLPADPSRLYYGTDTHAFGLAMGAALALALSGRFSPRAIGDPNAATVSARLLPAPGGRRPSAPALVLIDLLGLLALAGAIALGATLAWSDPRALGGGIALASLLALVVVAAATTPGSRLGRALDVAPMRWVGERSYGLYLWHWPVLVLVTAALGRGAAWWAVPAIALPLTVIAAVVSYRYLETPIRRRGLRGALDRIGERGRGFATVSWVLICGSVVVALVTASFIVGADRRTTAQLAIERGQEALAALAEQPPPVIVSPEERTGVRPPGPELATGPEITAIGDSVMLASAPEFAEAFPGISIDAAVSRHMSTAESLIADQLAAGTLRRVVVVGLATNGGFDPEVLPRILELIGPDRQLVLVSAQAPRDWIDPNNAALRDFALRMRAVELADWYTAIQPYIDTLADDDVHPGPTGAGIYAQSVKDALIRLTLVPPLVDEDERRWLPRAV